MRSNSEFQSTSNMIFAALYASLICVCSIIRLDLPFSPVPITMQMFAVFLASAMQSRKNAVLSVLVYIALGAVGIPVFSGLRGGVGVLVGPTGGFIIGFLAGAFVISTLAAHCVYTWQYAMAMLLGVAIIYIFGIIQFMLVTGSGIASALTAAVLPFILPDMVKICLAAVSVKYLLPLGTKLRYKW